MANPENFDLDFRPRSYWGPMDFETQIGSSVKGELRRGQEINDADEVHFDPEIIAEKLSDEHRNAVGRVHPWFMGGEYLPDLLPNEVEIARIVLKSATMDVVSIRARRTKHRIVYRIVDEYEPEFWEEQYSLTKKTSVKPLSMRELIELIDCACEGGLVGGGRQSNYSGLGDEHEDPEDYYDFETASSAFYPEIKRWYDTLNEEWLEKERETLPRRRHQKEEYLAEEVAAITDAADHDDPAALTALGYNFFLGRGVVRSREKAVELWVRASELGDPRGTFNLAVCYHDGLGVPRDQERALGLYEHLAESHYYVGLKMAGYCRHVGIGCQQDRYKALRWYFEISKSGNSGCNDALINCLRNMNGDTDLEKEVIKWVHERPLTARRNLIAAISKGRTVDPVKHDAGIGYLGVGQLHSID